MTAFFDNPAWQPLHELLEETADQTGEAFLASLVRQLATSLHVSHAFIAEFDSRRTTVRTLAFWSGGQLVPNIEYPLPGTPCEQVLGGGLCHYPQGIQHTFPSDDGLKRMRIESYLGVPLKERGGEVLGHLAIFDENPMPALETELFIFRLFAARGAAELTRMRMLAKLAESEQRYRDWFDSAPVAYIVEDANGVLLATNRAAMCLLRLSPHDLGTRMLATCKRRTHDLVKALGKADPIPRHDGEEPILVEYLLDDTSSSVWVEQWSQIEATTGHQRTVLIDVSERVRAEQAQQTLRQQNDILESEIVSARGFGLILGNSAKTKTLLEQIDLVARTDASVLILGETGTGKELVARAIHKQSRRSDSPLIRLNCAALPVAVVESELFGHEKGSFTGATSRRSGRFQLADRGTLFLDEIGEIPLEIQAKLLRAVQEGEIDAVGSQSPVHVNVRILAATNRDLGQAVKAKSFREDLYYRLNVFPIVVPPLRERIEDIPLLALHFANQIAERYGKRKMPISSPSMQRLVDYPWPGNIRELQNVIERAVILTRGQEIEIREEFLSGRHGLRAEDFAEATARKTMAEVERMHLLEVLQKCRWIIEGERGAAAVLGLHPNTLRSRLKKLGIQRPKHE